jgi:uncharacterized protein
MINVEIAGCDVQDIAQQRNTSGPGKMVSFPSALPVARRRSAEFFAYYQMMDIQRLKPQIDHICGQLSVRRLGVFGSVLRKDFGPASDVDVLVVFNEDSTDLFDKYFELKERLEEVLGREVGLIVDKPFRNPVFRDAVERTRTIIYEH